MADTTFNTTGGQTIARELMILYLNTSATSTPEWHPLGKRVEDSSAEYDWSDESMQDILGNAYNTLKKPIVTQSFDPYYLDSDDTAIVKIWNLAVKEQDAQALSSMDLLLVHFYAGDATTPFAERYPESSVRPTGLGGEGGGNMAMPIDVTYGGARQIGTASKDAQTGAITFTATV
jgi:hypothetical protein